MQKKIILSIITFVIFLIFAGATLYVSLGILQPSIELGNGYSKSTCLVTKSNSTATCEGDCVTANDDIWWYSYWGPSYFFVYVPGGSNGWEGNDDGGDSGDGDDDGDSGNGDGDDSGNGESGGDSGGGDSGGGSGGGGSGGGGSGLMMNEVGSISKGSTTGGSTIPNQEISQRRSQRKLRSTNSTTGYATTGNAPSMSGSNSIGSGSSGCGYCYQGYFDVTYNTTEGDTVDAVIYGLISANEDWVDSYVSNFVQDSTYYCYYENSNTNNVLWFQPPAYNKSSLVGTIVLASFALLFLIISIVLCALGMHQGSDDHGKHHNKKKYKSLSSSSSSSSSSKNNNHNNGGSSQYKNINNSKKPTYESYHKGTGSYHGGYDTYQANNPPPQYVSVPYYQYNQEEINNKNNLNNSNNGEDEFDEGKPISDESPDIDIKDLTVAESIGSGSYGVVYKGSYFSTDVAIKKIPGDHQKELQKYLKREVAVLKNIQHPNIVQFIGVYYDQNTSPSLVNKILNANSTWIVTEYIGGGNLHEKIKNSKDDFPFALRVKLSLDIALAMAYLHSRDIIFRDLKTKNILIDDSSSPMRGKVCDFGFARVLNKKQNSSKHLNSRLSLVGTDDFMAPEVIMGMEYDERADIFSFGIVLLEMSIRKKVSKVLERGPQTAFDIDQDRARELIPEDIPELFSELALECIKYEPEERPSFSHIINVLKQLSSLYPVVHTFDNPLSPTSSPITPRKNSLNSPFSKAMRMNSFDFNLSSMIQSPSVSKNLKNNNFNFSLNLNQLNQQQQQQQKQQQQQNKQQQSQQHPPSQQEQEQDHLDDNTSSSSTYDDLKNSLPIIETTNCDNNNNTNEDNDEIEDEEDLDKEEEENRKKVEHLKEKMLTVLKDFSQYIDKIGKELLMITEEEQISNHYDECRKVIEIKKVLGEVIEGEILPPTTPKKSNTNSRVAIFLKSMDRSLQEIHLSTEALKKRIINEEDLIESLLLARVVSKIKKIHLSNLVVV